MLIKLKFIITASKLWMTGPHEPEAGPEGGIKKNQQCFHRASIQQTTAIAEKQSDSFCPLKRSCPQNQ